MWENSCQKIIAFDNDHHFYINLIVFAIRIEYFALDSGSLNESKETIEQNFNTKNYYYNSFYPSNLYIEWLWPKTLNMERHPFQYAIFKVGNSRNI